MTTMLRSFSKSAFRWRSSQNQQIYNYNTTTTRTTKNKLATTIMRVTDYLVIGAGAASMSFVDTILTECPDATVTIVDGHGAPGGHWNDAYDYVHLHQPSIVYGVASEQLEGNWLKLILKNKGTLLPWQHRASKSELLAHYKMLMEKWVANGNVHYFPNCHYDFSKKPTWSPDDDDDNQVHTFQNIIDNNKKSYQIKVREKLVNGILGEARVPSKCPLEFPVDESAIVKTPNQIFQEFTDFKQQQLKTNNQGGGWFFSSSHTTDRKISPAVSKKYVVLGGGKTAMDAVVFLQRDMGVSADNIHWVIPNDVWILRREGPAIPALWPEALLRNDMDVDKAVLELEGKGAFARIDETVVPTKYRLPLVGADELYYLRKVEKKIRQGRMIGIVAKNNNNNNENAKPTTLLSATFQKGDPIDFPADTVFVHCASPGPFNGKKIDGLFPSPKEINLAMLFAPPFPISMSCLAVLEGRRRKGLLDLDFGRKLLLAGDEDGGYTNEEELSENEILNSLIQKYDFKDDFLSSNPMGQVDSLTTVAKFIALFDKDQDPKKGLRWLTSNRLSMLSVPGVKGKAYETVELMLTKRDTLQLGEGDVKQLNLLKERLVPLKGK